MSALNGIRPVVVAILAWALLDLSKRILTRGTREGARNGHATSSLP
jgi:hypothetical protein